MQFRINRRSASMLLVGALVTAGLGLTQLPVQAQAEKAPAPVKPPVAVSGQQAKPDIAPGSKDKASPPMKPLGATKLRAVDLNGKPASNAPTPKVGYDATVDFLAPYQYCQGDLVYTPVRNYSTVTKYFQIILYANGHNRTYYTSVAAGGTAYPYFYGVTGSYYAYLYVWNGSSYAYDEYRSSSNNCAVSATLTSTAFTGYLLLTLKNNGNAYASVVSNELAPYPGSGTYTGLHWDYPAPNGGTVSRYLYVGTGLKYGIYAHLYGARYYTPWYWWGTL